MTEPEGKKKSAPAFFFASDAAAGLVLVGATLLALILSNSPTFAPLLKGVLDTHITLGVGKASLDESVGLWINDGLMAIFFFSIGLELKREFVEGHLSTIKAATLPAVGAIGGMVVPALIYLGLNWSNADTVRGWAIPSATDIAFALGVMALLGSRVPASLKIFMMALATLDDLGAILIIAFFYTEHIAVGALGGAAAVIAIMLVLNRLKMGKLWVWMLLGLALWVFTFQSGVHATLAGVATGLLIPLRNKQGQRISERLEKNLQPLVKFFIMPVFALANAGVSFASLSISELFSPLPLGIVTGLVIGKPVGILSAVVIATLLGLAAKPRGASFGQVAGVACLGGIGFTMSLFIGGLAFQSEMLMNEVRLGVLTASLLATILGATILWAFSKDSRADNKS